MSLFARLNEAAGSRGLTFLVIGGHAVIAHGFVRGTEDADIVVCKDDRATWGQLLESFGYRVFHDGESFTQFESSDASEWNLDVMFVSADTFAQLMEAAKPTRLEGAFVTVPSLEHLLSLKIHALKHGRGLRALKDLTDVAQLLSANQVDPKAAWVRALFEKHEALEHYERVVQLLT